MSRQEANARVLQLMDHYSTEKNSTIAVEFFFYADKQDDASNLAIELHKLGYDVYNVTAPETGFDKWSVIGLAPKMRSDEAALNEWTDKMEKLAEENNSRFDGWGTLIDSK